MDQPCITFRRVCTEKMRGGTVIRKAHGFEEPGSPINLFKILQGIIVSISVHPGHQQLEIAVQWNHEFLSTKLYHHSYYPTSASSMFQNHNILDAQQNQWWVCRCWPASIYITNCWTSKFRLGCIRLERSMQWQLPYGFLFAHADDFLVGDHFHEFILALKKASIWNIWVLVSVTEAYRPIWKAIPIASLKLIRRTVEFTENAFWHIKTFSIQTRDWTGKLGGNTSSSRWSLWQFCPG